MKKPIGAFLFFWLILTAVGCSLGLPNPTPQDKIGPTVIKTVVVTPKPSSALPTAALPMTGVTPFLTPTVGQKVTFDLRSERFHFRLSAAPAEEFSFGGQENQANLKNEIGGEIRSVGPLTGGSHILEVGGQVALLYQLLTSTQVQVTLLPALNYWICPPRSGAFRLTEAETFTVVVGQIQTAITLAKGLDARHNMTLEITTRQQMVRLIVWSGYILILEPEVGRKVQLLFFACQGKVYYVQLS